METTSATLLERLRGPDAGPAWDRFARLYTPLLLHWARSRYGLQPADADDLVADVLADLVRTLPGFTYDRGRSFRGWLRGVLHHKWADRRRKAGRQPPAGAGGLSGVADGPAADPGEAEERTLLARRALELMQGEFEPSTWRACWETVAEARPAAEVAAELGISPNAVYLARSRVLRRLREEMAGLLD
jgi:RNA polymerase sigma-70 factor (ECF subfamily)